jgi:hypothetical protein
MSINGNLLSVAATLTLFVSSLLGQTPRPTLNTYISQSVREADTLYSATVEKWAAQHPGEVVETFADKQSEYGAGVAYKLSAREQDDRKLQGRWCLRSLTEIELDGGIRVRRIALFYQPLVELTYGKALPPLPTETGDELEKHGCRLVRILHEFQEVSNPQNLLETIAKQMPGTRVSEPGKFIEQTAEGYWMPICTFERFGDPIAYYHLFVRSSKVSNAEDSAAVLLEWEWGSLTYGQPSNKTIAPEAGQPWLALRAGKLARLGEGPTLDMLSFLAPQIGDTYEERPFHCHRQLIPVLRRWLDLADHRGPEQHGAAVLLADQVLSRLWYCEEFLHSGPYDSPEEDAIAAKEQEALENDLKELGVRTETGRLGAEYYSGNLRDEVLKLAPNGIVNELGRMAILNDRCQWDHNADSADCSKIIKEGESVLARFPEDEWTPSVHLILAEAYALTAANPEDEFSATPRPPKSEWEKKAAAHYRAWYAKSTNERDRALVWQEIWALEAGMGPWLLMPWELQQ